METDLGNGQRFLLVLCIWGENQLRVARVFRKIGVGQKCTLCPPLHGTKGFSSGSDNPIVSRPHGPPLHGTKGFLSGSDNPIVSRPHGWDLKARGGVCPSLWTVLLGCLLCSVFLRSVVLVSFPEMNVDPFPVSSIGVFLRVPSDAFFPSPL